MGLSRFTPAGIARRKAQEEALVAAAMVAEDLATVAAGLYSAARPRVVTGRIQDVSHYCYNEVFVHDAPELRAVLTADKRFMVSSHYNSHMSSASEQRWKFQPRGRRPSSNEDHHWNDDTLYNDEGAQLGQAIVDVLKAHGVSAETYPRELID